MSKGKNSKRFETNLNQLFITPKKDKIAEIHQIRLGNLFFFKGIFIKPNHMATFFFLFKLRTISPMRPKISFFKVGNFSSFVKLKLKHFLTALFLQTIDEKNIVVSFNNSNCLQSYFTINNDQIIEIHQKS